MLVKLSEAFVALVILLFRLVIVDTSKSSAELEAGTIPPAQLAPVAQLELVGALLQR